MNYLVFCIIIIIWCFSRRRHGASSRSCIVRHFFFFFLNLEDLLVLQYYIYFFFFLFSENTFWFTLFFPKVSSSVSIDRKSHVDDTVMVHFSFQNSFSRHVEKVPRKPVKMIKFAANDICKINLLFSLTM